jgi:glycosyltransferase involved in cell wall biosynthesis
MPLVSILIPACDSPFFATALDSALNQSLRDIEVIVSDDSAGHLAAEVVAAKADSRIRYVRNTPGLGFHGNFAQCHRLAQGQYLKFLNHDDVLRQDCVAQMVDAFQQLGEVVSMVFTRRARINTAGQVLPDDIQTVPIAQRNGPFRGAMLGNHCLVESANRIGEPSAVMFRSRDAAPNPASLFCINGREFTCLADLALWLRLLAKGDAYFLAEPLCGYRVHDEQLQHAAPVRTLCRTERFYLPLEARSLGFLENPNDYHRVLDQSGRHIDWAAARPDLTHEERGICAAAKADLAAEFAQLI